MERKWRRRNYFIKKELQGKYIFSFFLFVIAGAVIFTVIFSMLAADTLTVIYENHDLQIGRTPSILLRQILGAQWIFILTAGLAVVIVSMFLTHRFAGPMYRFEKSVEEMTKGHFDFLIRLRKRDEGKELAERMNELIDMVSSNVKEMRRLADDIEVRLADAGALHDAQDLTKASEGVREARSANRRLRGILDGFKIKNDD